MLLEHTFLDSEFDYTILTRETMRVALESKAPHIYEWLLDVVPQTSYRHHTGEKRAAMIAERMGEACIAMMQIARSHSSHLGINFAKIMTLVMEAEGVPQNVHDFHRTAHKYADRSVVRQLLVNKSEAYLRRAADKLQENPVSLESGLGQGSGCA